MPARKKKPENTPKKKRDAELDIDSLGPAKIPSPLTNGETYLGCVSDSQRVLIHPEVEDTVGRCLEGVTPPSLEEAGPREKIYFDPKKAKAAIVSCGGLCPGINSVIRAITLELYYSYGVDNILGIRYGLQGFIPKYGHPVVELTPGVVTGIHGRGGSFLGMSRGPQDIGEIVDSIDRMNISMLFMIGGDGTIRAAKKIQDEIHRQGMKVAVIGIPKTIDNDIAFVSRTFGFNTAVSRATESIAAAHNEAISVPNGIGLVKVMGRYAGFVAATTALALADVNFCLIPEVPFEVEGSNGLLAKLEARLVIRDHAVILVAEGAGQNLFRNQARDKDASGNVQLRDIGLHLKAAICDHFESKGIEHTLKYIDPSYMIRSLPADPLDRVYCLFLGQHAAHAAMAGKTGLIISKWSSRFVHVPMPMCTSRQKKVSATGDLWRSVQEVTGQGRLTD